MSLCSIQEHLVYRSQQIPYKSHDPFKRNVIAITRDSVISAGKKEISIETSGKARSHLLIAVGEVHEAIVVVVVVGALGRIGGQQQVVGAKAVALGVRVREDARLQQLVIRVANACAWMPTSPAGRTFLHGCQFNSWLETSVSRPSRVLGPFTRILDSSTRTTG